jgi:hypothetical protein
MKHHAANMSVQKNRNENKRCKNLSLSLSLCAVRVFWAKTQREDSFIHRRILPSEMHTNCDEWYEMIG